MLSRLIARLKAWLPTPQTLLAQRWLRWLAPYMTHPRLWHLSRKGVALGVALGIFFGLLLPFAQMPAATGMAIVLRANVPVAIASTFVTNPLTFGPIYYVAYRLGRAVLPESQATPPPEAHGEADRVVQDMVQEQQDVSGRHPWRERLARWWQRLGQIGKPLIVGLALLATASGLAVYFIAEALWRLRVRWNRRQRRRERAQDPGDGAD